MIWRSAIVAAYIALAIVVGVAYGVRGLAVLLFAYAWAVFIPAWGWASEAAGRWNFHRLDAAPFTRRASRLGLRRPRPETDRRRGKSPASA